MRIEVALWRARACPLQTKGIAADAPEGRAMHNVLTRAQAIAASSAAAASVAAPTRVRSATLTPIKVGVANDEDFAEGYYAKDKGFFEQAGLDADLTSMANGGALTAAVVSGSLDIVTTNSGSMSTAHARGVPLVLLFPAGLYESAKTTAALMVMKNSPIQSAKDLTGKKVAMTTLNTLYHVSTRNWIDANGGDSSQVQFIEIPLSIHLIALRDGRVDAAAMVEPWVSPAKPEARMLGVPYDSIGKRFMIAGWVTTQDYITRNPATVKAFVSAIRKTADWANTHPAEIPPILARNLKVPLEQITSIPRATMGTALDPALIQPVIDAEYRYKLLPKSFSAAELFYRG
jgi:NitT/TauT family transport system substrate-binding protein